MRKASSRKASSGSGCASLRGKRVRRLSYPPNPLYKRDSQNSIATSDCSGVDSDWSDDDLEEMEKIFGDIQQRLNDVADGDDEDENAEGNEHLFAVTGVDKMKCVLSLSH